MLRYTNKFPSLSRPACVQRCWTREVWSFKLALGLLRLAVSLKQKRSRSSNEKLERGDAATAAPQTSAEAATTKKIAVQRMIAGFRVYEFSYVGDVGEDDLKHRHSHLLVVLGSCHFY